MLRDILRAFAEYKTLSVIFFAALALLVFVLIMASRAVRRHNAARDRILNRLQEEEALRRKYADLTRETALSSDGRELLHGTALIVQRKLDGKPDLTAAFAALSEAQQFIYALDYVLCEDAETLSAFFRLNGKPLTTAALGAARASFEKAHLDLFERAYAMFDPDDETASSLPQDVKAVDEAFQENPSVLFDSIRNYIAENVDLIKGA